MMTKWSHHRNIDRMVIEAYYKLAITNKFIDPRDMIIDTIASLDCDSYVVMTEVIQPPDFDSNIIIDSAYSREGCYIGIPTIAQQLASIGIYPEIIDQSHYMCSIGFCDAEQRWYGWNHMDIAGFGIGDKAYIVDPYNKNVGAIAQSLVDTRDCAIAFTISVV